jgi:N-acetylneuraminic acid mutarotase
MTAGRWLHSATLLRSGQVLLTGGFNGSGNVLNTAEVYDPVAKNFMPITATTTSARTGHTATLLPNGQVLLTGGGEGQSLSSFSALNTAELYDPLTNTFTPLRATMTAARVVHTATLLPNGEVLIAGGANNITGPAPNTAELYDQ